MATIKLIVLTVVLAVSVYTDLKWRKIPNWLVYPAMLAGMALGYIDNGRLGFYNSLKGILLAFIVLFVCYLMASLGAGDVKLFMVAGSFLGPNDLMYAGLWLVAFSLAWVLPILIKNKRLLKSLKWTWDFIKYLIFKLFVLKDRERERPRIENGIKIPFGPVVAAACIVQSVIVWGRLF